MNHNTIDFSSNCTTKEALVYIGRFSAVVARNTCRAIDNAAHRFPWAFIITILLVNILVSFVYIGQARAERDKYSKSNARLQQQVDAFRTDYGELKR